ncbi:hypothetical protein JB92DRAFT_3204792, partial [Gautieria morchelliformis]
HGVVLRAVGGRGELIEHGEVQCVSCAWGVWHGRSRSIHVRYAPAAGAHFMAPGACACGMLMVYFCATRIAAMRSSFHTSSIIRSASPILQRAATTHMGKCTSGADVRVRVERLCERREGEEEGVPLMERRSRGVCQRGRWFLGACFGLLEDGGGYGVEEKGDSGSSSCRMGGAALRASALPPLAWGTWLEYKRGGWTRGEGGPMRLAQSWGTPWVSPRGGTAGSSATSLTSCPVPLRCLTRARGHIHAFLKLDVVMLPAVTPVMETISPMGHNVCWSRGTLFRNYVQQLSGHGPLRMENTDEIELCVLCLLPEYLVRQICISS